MRKRVFCNDILCCAACIAVLLCACEGKRVPEPAGIARVQPLIMRTLPHDRQAFTQGFACDTGSLYESTGLYGRSSLRRIDPATGEILQQAALDERVFGEGLAVSGDALVQLTWQSGRAFVYSRSGFAVADTYSYEGEGWGLAAAPEGFVMSNGSDTIYYHDRRFQRAHSVAVTLGGKPLRRLNELEYARGMIYANVWYSNFVFEIDPVTGRVQRVIDCTSLVEQAGVEEREDVLNGIAYDAARDRFFLTGKNWPLIFEVVIPSRSPTSSP